MSLDFRRDGPEINLTPMIDVLFMVLMFLLLSTTFKEFTFIRVTLPESVTGRRESVQQTDLRITVERSGVISLGDRPVSMDELGRILSGVRDKDAANVHLAADKALEHGTVVQVMDLIRRAGIYRLSIQTLSEKPPVRAGS